MNKTELLFYDAYEDFYSMADKSRAFRLFCRDAFGEDLSQDGFSDLSQINRILQYIPVESKARILDIGCGNGKMLGYLQGKTGACIYGFDYSEQAIRTAKEHYPVDSQFREGIIGEIEYPQKNFDVIISMDSMYFAKDMTKFTAQIKGWLKDDGIFFVGYQEGDVIPKTESIETAQLTLALQKNDMPYEAIDITEQTYTMLRKKRETALAYQEDFESEGHKRWFDMLILQTECVEGTYEEFSQKMARYIYIARKKQT